MIKSFKDNDTEKLFHRYPVRKIAANLQKVALRKLLMLHEAADLDDLRVPPANRLERLKGDRWEQYSIRINNRWRICFVWKNREAHQVEIVDYH